MKISLQSTELFNYKDKDTFIGCRNLLCTRQYNNTRIIINEALRTYYDVALYKFTLLLLSSSFIISVRFDDPGFCGDSGCDQSLGLPAYLSSVSAVYHSEKILPGNIEGH